MLRLYGSRVAGLLVAVAVVAIVLGYRSPASSSSFTVSASPAPAAPAQAPPRRERHRRPGRAGSAVPAGTTVFDDGVAGVARLDPALLGALRRAASDAAGDGVVFVVDSGWRSPAYQDRLRREAVAKYGSEAEAARWVATAATSPHVSGDAIDLGRAAASWLASRGAAYGLCRIYANEPWHYELRPEAAGQGCPRMYADPTHDPRMQR